MASRGDGGAIVRDGALPAWLAVPEDYVPTPDRDGFVTKSLLGLSAMLAQLRIDDGKMSPWSASAAPKLVLTLCCVVLVSLARNYLFALVMLAIVLVRACLLPVRALRRAVAVAGGAAVLTLIVMLPATLMGQPHSAVTLATKALVSTGLMMELALTTPLFKLTRALRALHVPGIAILTVELALRSIVDMGTVALEALEALRLRSVGVNRDKASSMGGIGGVVFVKAARAAGDTYDAMRCRGFTGEYEAAPDTRWRVTDTAWTVAFVALVALFARLEGAI